MNDIRAPYLSYDHLRQKADAFLRAYHPSRDIPVPIEKIVDNQFKIDIVPALGLRDDDHDIVAFITSDFAAIWVDEYIVNHRVNRYRFSLAHELGHSLLHKDVFAKLKFSTLAAWKEQIGTAIPEKEYGYLEYQASSFAGLILVPPEALEDVYDEACQKIEEAAGLSIERDLDVAKDYIAKYIGNMFAVSVDVVSRRLRYDGIWTKD